MRSYNACLAFAPASSLSRCWKPRYPSIPSTPSSQHEAVAFQLQKNHRRRYYHSSTNHNISIMRGAVTNNNESVGPISNVDAANDNAESAGPSSSSELEIEKKFAIPDAQTAKNIEETLITSLGFQMTRKEDFVDWYFDLPAPGWHFTLQDCWFRYREKKVKIGNNWGWRGAWQVKRGHMEEDNGGAEARKNDGMTVYEELQGEDAKKLILDMLAILGDDVETSNTNLDAPSSAVDSLYNGYDVPYLAGAERLVPFARLETFRTCYEATNSDGEFSALKVDVDKTDFGYMVGEVEAVLDDVSEDKAKVEAAKESIRKLVDLISISENNQGDGASSMSALGKLEYYMINNHRDHYDACVKSGAMMN